MIYFTRRTIHRIGVSLLTFLLAATTMILIVQNSVKTAQQNNRDSTQLRSDIRILELQDELEQATYITDSLDLVIQNNPSHTVDDFENVAKKLINEHPYISSVQLAPGGDITMVYPEDERAKLNLLEDPESAPIARFTMDLHEPTCQGPFNLKQGGTGMALCNPVYIGDPSLSHFWGFAIVILKVPETFESAFHTMEKRSLTYRLTKTDPLRENKVNVVYTNLKDGDEMDSPVYSTFEALGCHWKLELMPEGGWKSNRDFKAITITSLIIAILFGGLIYLILVIIDQSKRMANLSYFDGLTKVRNVRSFQQVSKDCFDKNKPCGLFYIDINFFKDINDQYGHDVGDIVLQETASRLKFVSAYLVYRLGGDEFVVFVDDEMSEDGYKELRKKIEGICDTPIEIRDISINLTLSIGYASSSRDALDRETLIRIADERMYEDKQIKHAQRK